MRATAESLAAIVNRKTAKSVYNHFQQVATRFLKLSGMPARVPAMRRKSIRPRQASASGAFLRFHFG